MSMTCKERDVPPDASAFTLILASCRAWRGGRSHTRPERFGSLVQSLYKYIDLALVCVHAMGFLVMGMREEPKWAIPRDEEAAFVDVWEESPPHLGEGGLLTHISPALHVWSAWPPQPHLALASESALVDTHPTIGSYHPLILYRESFCYYLWSPQLGMRKYCACSTNQPWTTFA